MTGGAVSGGARLQNRRLKGRGHRDSCPPPRPCGWSHVPGAGLSPLVLLPPQEMPQQVTSFRGGPQVPVLTSAFYTWMAGLTLTPAHPGTVPSGDWSPPAPQLLHPHPHPRHRPPEHKAPIHPTARIKAGVEVSGKLRPRVSKKIEAYAKLLPSHPSLAPPLPVETQNHREVAGIPRWPSQAPLLPLLHTQAYSL